MRAWIRAESGISLRSGDGPRSETGRWPAAAASYGAGIVCVVHSLGSIASVGASTAPGVIPTFAGEGIVGEDPGRKLMCREVKRSGIMKSSSS